VTDVSFTIQFPRFDTSPRKVEIETGINVIYGESGVGKSALCHWLSSAKEPETTTNFTLLRIRDVDDGMLVMQDPDDQIVAPTVYSELAFNLENLGWESKKIRERIRETVTQFELEWDLDRHPATLSGGEREILNLATALSVKPTLLVLDDALAFLSDVNKSKMLSLLGDYCQKNEASVLWVTPVPWDLQYGTQTLELTLDSLKPAKMRHDKRFKAIDLIPGSARLEFRKLTFGYDREGELFSDQTIVVDSFRSLALLGDNGAGKSTLGSIIVGSLSPQQGESIIALSHNRKVKIGFLPQSPERYFGGWTMDEIADELIDHGLLTDHQLAGLIESLRKYQISWELIHDQPVYSLRISVVRIALTALMCCASYDVVILDEPLFSLGVVQRRLFLEILEKYLREKHLILITHSNRLAEAVCDRSVIIENGQLRQGRLTRKSHA